MERRGFIGGAAAAGLWAALGDWMEAFAAGAASPAVGKPLAPWRKGELQVHFIHTGRAESLFFIFPDGTTMLLDAGDYDIPTRKKSEVPVLPNRSKGAGEWIARYVRRVNPQGSKVDYWMLSHWHADHGGCETSYSRREERDGDDWFASGLAEASDYLDFGKGFDRCWPDVDFPFPMHDGTCRELSQISRTYRYLERHKGLAIEKFRVGALNQIAAIRDPASCPGFSVRNICGNGFIYCRDGSVKNLYEGVFSPEYKSGWRNENGMSCGFVMTYGKFRFYTAGDFQDFWTNPDGTKFSTEALLARELDPVDVAKANHHGCEMDADIVAALAPRVWVTCVFAQHNNQPQILKRFASRELYPGDRAICPTCYPAKRQVSDGGAEWTKDIAKAAYDCGHVVLTVPPGGDDYTITYLDASDESMTVKSVMKFKSGRPA